ncbi:PDZ domain-containing protein [Hydrogenobaculum acidophilum]
MKKISINPLILMFSFTIVFISISAFYYNLKSLKYVLNQETPTLTNSFNKNALIEAVEKFKPSQNKTQSTSSNSNMFVLAIAYSQNPAYSMVLVNSSCGKKVLMVGNSFCGFTIEQIKPFYIIASQNGKTLTLKLSKGEQTNHNSIKTPSGLPSLQQLLSGGSSQNTYTISRNELLEITSNPYKMFSDIDLVPTSKGFMFKSVKQGSLFAQMGIRPGDILLSINNETLNSPEDAFRILGTLRNSDSFNVKILRDNVPITLYYKVD